MMPGSLRGRFILLLFSIFMLVLLAVGVTFWSLDTLKHDALLVNLAGRQRMLVQQMTREALELGIDPRPEPHAQILREASLTFEQTLAALQTGGDAPTLPGSTVLLTPPRNAALLAQLNQVRTAWGAFQGHLQILLDNPVHSAKFQTALLAIQSASPGLLSETDAAVRLLESGSTLKVTRLRWIQAIFLACTVLLVAGATWLVRSSILAPLGSLSQAAQHIGSGNLTTPVDVSGPLEMQALGGSLDQMRAQLLASHLESQAWTDQLEQRVALRTQELEAFYTVSREISSRLAIQDVLRSITQKTRQLLDCDVVFLCLLNENGQRLLLQATSAPEGAIVQSCSPANNATVDSVLTGEGAQRCDEGGCRGYCEMVAARYRTSHIAAALKIERQIIGALCVGSAQPGKFGQEALDALTKLANIAAIALQNARLYDQAERLATAEERQRIAAEMHDGLAQTLSYTKLVVNQAALQIEGGQAEAAVDTLEGVNSALDQAIEDIRRSIASLQEQGPLNTSLQEQLAALAAESSPQGPQVEWTCSVQAPLVLPRHDTQQVLRVAQEALQNARHHSAATRILLRLEQDGAEYRLTVQDNGQGFEPQAPLNGDGRQHFGLKIMRARAARLRGRVEIQSTPGAGVLLALAWPVGEELA